MEISRFSPVKLAISVWLWRRRLLLFVFLASLKPFGFKLSLGICILSQGGLWVTVSAIVAWPGCLAVLRACLASTPYALCSKGFGELVCHLIYLQFWLTESTITIFCGRQCIESGSFINENLDFLVVLWSRSSKYVVDSLGLCVC